MIDKSKKHSQPNQLKPKTPKDGERTGIGPDAAGETPRTPEEAALQREQQQLAFERAKLNRHSTGTDQVQHILKSGHITASILIGLAAFLALTMFWMGLKALTSSEASDIAWYTQLLVFIPTTLLAILGVTIWITSLKFSAQIYNGVTEKDNENSSLANECIKFCLEAAKQNNSP